MKGVTKERIVNSLENMVRQFGEQTQIKTGEAATKLGVLIDRQYLDKCFAVNWAMTALVAEEAGEIVEFQQSLANEAEGSSSDEIGVAFCLNTCRGGFVQIETGEYALALETFGLVRSVLGYLLKNDFRKMFAANGKKGGNAKNAAMNRVKNEMINTFRKGGNWKSTRQAAKNLAGKAKEIAKKEGAQFTTDDVAARVYEWFLKAEKV